MPYTNIFEYDFTIILNLRWKNFIPVLISIVVTILSSEYISETWFFYRPLWQQIVFVSVMLGIPIIHILYHELPHYLLVRDMTIKYDEVNKMLNYTCGDDSMNFSFSDIDLLEVYRTVKDESYIGYVVTLKNGTRLRFTNRLDGIKKLLKDIEASGVKVEDKTWFDNKHLPENIYKD